MYIRVHVVAGTKKEIVQKKDDTTFLISIREKAERGMANERVLTLIRREFPDSGKISIINGHHSPVKLLSI
jgi:uncharacterized protein YggU (UPF0235/DUF167 family)